MTLFFYGDYSHLDSASSYRPIGAKVARQETLRHISGVWDMASEFWGVSGAHVCPRLRGTSPSTQTHDSLLKFSFVGIHGPVQCCAETSQGSRHSWRLSYQNHPGSMPYLLVAEGPKTHDLKLAIGPKERAFPWTPCGFHTVNPTWSLRVCKTA